MMKFLEKLKDILYDSIDYIIMLAIVVIVVFVIGWRLDVLFAKDAYEPKNNDTIIVDNSTRPKPNDVHNAEDGDKENPDEKPDESVKPEEPNKPDNSTNPGESTPPTNVEAEVVNVKIPDGSLPGKIGNILAEYGLVNSSKEFVDKAVEMKLETKLRSGSFEIPKGSDLEKIVKIIAKR